jgi:hypothetical protein
MKSLHPSGCTASYTNRKQAQKRTELKILDQHKLEKFDILLVRFPEDENSLKIRESCKSEFSHAVIYLGNGSFIEGVAPTVSLFSYHRYYFKNLDDVCIIRLKDELKPNFDSEQAENFLRSLSFSDYSKRLLYFIEKKSITQNVTDTFFKSKKWIDGIVCTTLITLPYYVGGVDISKKNEPYYSHFGDIEKFDGFEDVTDKVFIDIDKDKIDKNTFDYHTTYDTGTLLEKQSSIVKDLNKYVKSKFQEIKKNLEDYKEVNLSSDDLNFTSWEDIFPILMKTYLTETGQQIDNDLAEIIKDSGYDLLWFEEVHKNKHQFFPFYFFPFLKINNKPDLEFLKNTLSATLKRIEKDEDTVFQNFTLCPCNTFHILLDMYRSFSDLLRSSVNQYNGIIKEYDKLIK